MLRCDRLIDLRKSKSLIQQEVADILLITRPAYNKYEKGVVQPPNDTIVQLANFFDVSTDYLLGRSDIPTPLGQKEKAPSFEGLDPEKDRAYFSVMAGLKREGLSPHDLEVIAQTYLAAKKHDKEGQ